MRQLSDLDASFFYLESRRTPLHIGSVALYDPSTIPDGKFDFDRLQSYIAARLHRAKSLRERLVHVPLNIDRPYWINDPDFDIDYHVRHSALPRPGTWQQLTKLASRLLSQPLDMDYPLWELYVVEGVDAVEGVPKGSYAIISKVHHAAVDGVSGIEVTAAIHGLTADEVAEEPVVPWRPEPVPTNVELLGRAWYHSALYPMRTAKALSNQLPGLQHTLQSALNRRKRIDPDMKLQGPRTRFNGSLSAHRVFDAARFDLKEIIAVKNAAGGLKVNDVVLAICSGSLRKYLEAKRELPAEPLLSMVPVSVRSEDQKGDMGNQISIMSVPLGTHIADPAARLTFVKEAQTQRKELLTAVGARQLQDYSTMLPAALTGLAARLYTQLHVADRMAPVFNTLITNVPGPNIPIYNAGAQMHSIHGFGPTSDGMGLSHVILSYCDTLVISVTSCRAMLPDIEFYVECLHASFEELKEAVLESVPAKPVRRSRKVAGKTAGKAPAKARAGSRAKPGTGKKTASKPAAKKTSSRKARANGAAHRPQTG